MTETAVQNPYEAGTEPDDFTQAADFPEPDPDAPYGYMVDRATGERRPKKAPGRPRVPPTAEELRAAGPPPGPEPDKAPAEPQGRTWRLRGHREPPPDVPMPAGGIIAAGVNRLYRRAGRIVRAMDEDIGDAIIECTRPDPEDKDWLTVGQAWENLAKDSPRIRRWLVRLIRGGAVQDLILAHAPIGMALVMKPAIAKLLARIPGLNRLSPVKLAAAFFSDEDGADGKKGGLAEEDVRKMAEQAGVDLEQMAAQVAARMRGVPRDHLGPRSQPRNRSRAARRK